MNIDKDFYWHNLARTSMSNLNLFKLELQAHIYLGKFSETDLQLDTQAQVNSQVHCIGFSNLDFCRKNHWLLTRFSKLGGLK